ncbi:hypothetical protein [Microbacterium sp. KUDC0406]|nr:hypothetical protein [Microbacterium sp. KUDC0406]
MLADGVGAAAAGPKPSIVGMPRLPSRFVSPAPSAGRPSTV